MSGTTEAFARVKIDSLLKDAGWNLTDGSVLFGSSSSSSAALCTSLMSRLLGAAA